MKGQIRGEALAGGLHLTCCKRRRWWRPRRGGCAGPAALHQDIGRFLERRYDSYGYHRHDQSGGDWLARHFGPAVSEPVRFHVAAKRYLCAIGPDYRARLSPASVHTLSKQGGPMSPTEATAFAAHPFAEAVVRLRRWDDGGKMPEIPVPALVHYRPRIARLLGDARKSV